MMYGTDPGVAMLEHDDVWHGDAGIRAVLAEIAAMLEHDPDEERIGDAGPAHRDDASVGDDGNRDGELDEGQDDDHQVQHRVADGHAQDVTDRELVGPGQRGPGVVQQRDAEDDSNPVERLRADPGDQVRVFAAHVESGERTAEIAVCPWSAVNGVGCVLFHGVCPP